MKEKNNLILSKYPSTKDIDPIKEIDKINLNKHDDIKPRNRVKSDVLHPTIKNTSLYLESKSYVDKKSKPIDINKVIKDKGKKRNKSSLDLFLVKEEKTFDNYIKEYKITKLSKHKNKFLNSSGKNKSKKEEYFMMFEMEGFENDMFEMDDFETYSIDSHPSNKLNKKVKKKNKLKK